MRASLILLLFACFLSGCQSSGIVTDQIMIPRIASMPAQPSPFKMTDWSEKAKNFDSYVFKP